jgi:murein DD-endopeptidase MepM/ murein hydrolase activator NlpD
MGRVHFLVSLAAALGAVCSCETGDGGVGSGAGAGGLPTTAGRGGAAGSSGTAGSSAGSGALSGASGHSAAGSADSDSGGTAGRTAVAGASGATPADAGATSQAGTPGEGVPGEAGTSGEAGAPAEPVGLSWPIACIPGQTCVSVGYPDTDADGDAHDCGAPGYVGHEGTDIVITPEAQATGTAVHAAAGGEVVFAFDGKYDQCPDASEPDCQAPSNEDPGSSSGTTVCTSIGRYCGTGTPGCFWCFAGGNVIVIRHDSVPGVFATRYDHLKRSSVLVEPGDRVTRGEKIAEAASSGASTAPHLHFEVWGTGFYELADPWAGPCGPNLAPSLWAHDPPW